MINFLKLLQQQSKEAQYPEGLEKAIIGMGTRNGALCFVLSRERCLELLQKKYPDLDEYQVRDWMKHEIEGVNVGGDTPYFVDEEWGEM